MKDDLSQLTNENLIWLYYNAKKYINYKSLRTEIDEEFQRRDKFLQGAIDGLAKES